MNTQSVARRPFWMKALGIVVLALVGGGVGYAVATLTDTVVTTWEDTLALGMAVATVGAAAISAGVMLTRPRSVPRGCGFLQILVLLLAGVLFLAPMFGAALASPDLVFGGVIVLLVVQSIANLMLWRQADEMLRRIMSETSAMAFWALQVALFVYAAAERLGLVDSVSGWGLLGILMAVYLIASIIASARRGIH